MKFRLLIFALFCFGMTFAQSTPERYTESFFLTFKNDRKKAVDELFKSNIWLTRVQDNIDNLKSEVEKLNEDSFGKYYGFEKINEVKFNDTYTVLSFLAKFDRQPIRFVFKFYKPNDKWMIHSLTYDTDFDDDLELPTKNFNQNLK
ncbi:hypothetical protein QGN23_03770 [Chryseobacterium gotjawalense]|uniref:DUF4878 domain-containing protein n=1 Tax=Chryseobacterium gotjawalense TaxID=3042315 RepID=A0ABY8RH91_9FLAO|nr:hypothetical protein [Chryseobacterium sp. wdc7]WHF52404.1 hypothetical protein QGN23_03770 [Chryseobacterium sp. wdc7]